MTDAQTRRYERDAQQGDPDAAIALLRRRIREGAEASWGLEADLCVMCRGRGKVPIDESWTDMLSCPGCACTGYSAGHGTHRLTYLGAPLWDLVRLGAYCGHEAARGALGIGLCSACGTCCVQDIDGCLSCPLDNWITGLTRLAVALPAVRVAGVACVGCGGPPGRWPRHRNHDLRGPCFDCQGTGTRTIVVPAERWLSTRVAIAVARAVLAHLKATSRNEYWLRETEALDAAEAWTRCPCPSLEEAVRVAYEAGPWDSRTPFVDRDDASWTIGLACSVVTLPWEGSDGQPLGGQLDFRASLNRAGIVLTPDAVRAAACAEVLALVRL